MSRRFAVLVTAAVILIIVVSWLGVFHFSGVLPRVPASEVIVDSPQFPTTLASSNGENRQWTAIVEEDLVHSGWTIRRWSTPHDDSLWVPTLTLAVKASRSPIGAWLWFRDALGVGSPIALGEGAKRVSGWSYVSASASEQTVGCGLALWIDEQGETWCQEWLYAARYGQFHVYVRYLDVNSATSLRDFERIVGAIEPAVSVALVP